MFFFLLYLAVCLNTLAVKYQFARFKITNNVVFKRYEFQCPPLSFILVSSMEPFPYYTLTDVNCKKCNDYC